MAGIAPPGAGSEVRNGGAHRSGSLHGRGARPGAAGVGGGAMNIRAPLRHEIGIDLTALERTIAKAQKWLLRAQYPEGFWWGELESNVTITAEYLLLGHFLGIKDEARWRKIANYLLEQQREDGTWAIWFGGPGDLSTTIEAYFALKLAGVDPDRPEMERAREFILSQGGVPNARIFTKIWLALFGQWRWEDLPVMPPELMLLPSWFPFNIYEFASWARGTIVPLLIVLALRPTVPIPESAKLDELYPEPRQARYPIRRKPGLWGWFFWWVDWALRLLERSPSAWTWKPLRQRAIKAAERWILAHQEADGSWGGIQPPWVYSLIALKALGYGLDHPVMRKGLEGFERFAIEEGDTWRVQSCVSPVWDTALSMIALLDSGLPPDHPALIKAGRWLLGKQVLHSGGDWQIKMKGTKCLPGGWPFEFENDLYPDIDDTAVVMLALLRTELPQAEKQRALERGLQWLLAMQSRCGGWGAFDKDNTKRFITQIPFADFGAVIDPPSVDVTAHVLELLGELGYDSSSKAVRRALSYIKREQEPDGSWFGRWGVNYIYGTGAVLPALAALGEDM
ncbi:TPA: squalene--hopene cyclase, partial [Candidatus Bipolaricaulota bacterium]|nr:squalene--hopene cyclase [Candidatus Bipolaricaulota bacterium]